MFKEVKNQKYVRIPLRRTKTDILVAKFIKELSREKSYEDIQKGINKAYMKVSGENGHFIQ